jgi:threonylcarbamoyladenosine tRNA methylthiotransferase MtaB
MASSFHIENFGCRAARADGEAVASLLRAAGMREDQHANADVVVVNTCSVTAEADREARAFIRRANRLNPEARIIATGCYAQRAPEELAALPGVAAVVGNSHKALTPAIALHLVDLARSNGTAPDLNGANFGEAMTGISAPEGSLSTIVSLQSLLTSSSNPNHAPVLADDTFAHSFLEAAPVLPGAQTRPNLKIQEGCGNRCSFCVIPQTRGSSRSLPSASVLHQIASYVAAGGKELVLSGINLGRWGRDFSASEQTRTLASLVRRIFAQTDLPRLRLSSIEPMDWDRDLISVMHEFGGSRLARHAHLPLQSGSDAVLRRMHRRYRPWHYAEKAASLLKAAGPELTLGADVMVGFPGETDDEFTETLAFIRELPFGYLHLFPFSARPGTSAWQLHADSPLSAGVVEERMSELRALATEKSRAHRLQFVSQELDAITLHTPPALEAAGRTSALSANFLPIELNACLQANRLERIRVTGLSEGGALLATSAQQEITESHDRDWPLPASAAETVQFAL